MTAPPLRLELDGFKKWGLAALFPSSSSRKPDEATLPESRVCNALSFSDTGKSLVSSHNDGVLKLFSGETGNKEAELYSRQYGCRLVTHTHHDACVLHAAQTNSPSDPNVGQIAYHSLHDNKIIRFFKAHTAPVCSINVNSRTDWFVSTSRDGTFKLWDMRTPNCQASGVLDQGGRLTDDATASFDLSGRVFAVATPGRGLAMYDATDFSKGPFECTPLPLLQETVPARGPSVCWTGIEFSPDERFLALATADRGVLIVDAYYPQRELALLASHPIDPLAPCNVSWSPCGGFLATGGADGHVYVYSLSGAGEVEFCGSAAEEAAGLPASSKQQHARVALGKLSDGVTLGPLPYTSSRWNPPFVTLGEGLKTAAAAARARPVPAAAGGPHARVPGRGTGTGYYYVPPASGPEDQVSRHEGPVRAVRFHPRSAVLASGSSAVAWWLPG